MSRLGPFEQGLKKSREGDYSGAIQAFDQALLLDPNDAETYGNRCVARHRSGDTQGAIADCQKAADLYLKQGNLARHEYALKSLAQLKKSSLGEKVMGNRC